MHTICGGCAFCLDSHLGLNDYLWRVYSIYLGLNFPYLYRTLPWTAFSPHLSLRISLICKELPNRNSCPLFRDRQYPVTYWYSGYKDPLSCPSLGFPGGANGKEPACLWRRHKRLRFNPWFRKIPWRRAWQPTPVVLPRESHGLRSLLGYSPRGLKESHMAKRLILFFLFSYKSGPKFAQAFLVCNHFALFQQLTLSQGSQISTCRERP